MELTILKFFFYVAKMHFYSQTFALEGTLNPFQGLGYSLVGVHGVSGLLATPSKNGVPRVQEIRPKLTWLGFLDYPRYQSD